MWKCQVLILKCTEVTIVSPTQFLPALIYLRGPPYVERAWRQACVHISFLEFHLRYWADIKPHLILAGWPATGNWALSGQKERYVHTVSNVSTTKGTLIFAVCSLGLWNSRPCLNYWSGNVHFYVSLSAQRLRWWLLQTSLSVQAWKNTSSVLMGVNSLNAEIT